MAISKRFMKRVKTLYPKWTKLHEAIENGDPIAGRYLYDASDGMLLINKEITRKEYNMRASLYGDYLRGRHLTSTGDRRKFFGCPRIYAQNCGDSEVQNCDKFGCRGYGHIPDCPKFKSGICWELFDALGFKENE